MRTRSIIAAGVAAVVVGAGFVVTPMVLAADTDDNGTKDDTTMPGWGMHDGRQGWGNGPAGRGRGFGMHGGAGQGMQGQGMQGGAGQGMQGGAGPGERGQGDCPMLDEDGTAQGTLTQDQQADLLAQLEHEKLAHDVYVAFFDSTGDYRFERIARSEAHHLDALQVLADRYDLSDPTKGLDQGEFESGSVQDAYDAYVAQGDDLESALKAAQKIEKDDIADLTRLAEDVEDAPDVDRVYQAQAMASQHHLAAFSR